jgi:hypothetical protein
LIPLTLPPPPLFSFYTTFKVIKISTGYIVFQHVYILYYILFFVSAYTDKREKEIFLIYIGGHSVGIGCKVISYCMRKGFLTYKDMRKYLTIYEEAVSHI